MLLHRSQKKFVLVNGGFAGESGIDNNLYEGGRRGTKRMFEEYDNGKLSVYLTLERKLFYNRGRGRLCAKFKDNFAT